MCCEEVEDKVDSDNFEPKKKTKNLVLLSIVINILLASSTGYMFLERNQITSQLDDYSLKINELTESTINLEKQLTMATSQLDYYQDLADYYTETSNNENGIPALSGYSTIPIVAVQNVQSGFNIGYEGVVMEAEIELVPGQGRILIDTIPKIGIDLQSSVRTAVINVERLTGNSLSSTDIILTVKSQEEVEVVDGQSAGAALTIAILAACTNQSINQDTCMTGTINSDGSIGPVGGILEKALAAAEKGSTHFLVPQNQSTITYYEPKISGTRHGRTLITYEKKTIDLEEYLTENGYSVIIHEVDKIEDALPLFFNEYPPVIENYTHT